MATANKREERKTPGNSQAYAALEPWVHQIVEASSSSSGGGGLLLLLRRVDRATVLGGHLPRFAPSADGEFCLKVAGSADAIMRVRQRRTGREIFFLFRVKTGRKMKVQRQQMCP
jgi:hypothetical protein